MKRARSFRAWAPAVLALSIGLGASSCATQGIYGEPGQSGQAGEPSAITKIREQAESAATATVVACKRGYVDLISVAARAHEAGTLTDEDWGKVLEAGWKVYPALLAADEGLKAYFKLTITERDPAALVSVLVDLQMAYNAFRTAASVSPGGD